VIVVSTWFATVDWDRFGPWAVVTGASSGIGREFARQLLLPGATNTPVLERFGVQPGSSPLKPMTVEQCVTEGLTALSANRATQIPGRLNRVFDRVVPGRAISMMMGRMAGQWAGHMAAQKAGVPGEAR
jgi:short-subunit dehydrogenase